MRVHLRTIAGGEIEILRFTDRVWLIFSVKNYCILFFFTDVLATSGFTIYGKKWWILETICDLYLQFSKFSYEYTVILLLMKIRRIITEFSRNM